MVAATQQPAGDGASVQPMPAEPKPYQQRQAAFKEQHGMMPWEMRRQLQGKGQGAPGNVQDYSQMYSALRGYEQHTPNNANNWTSDFHDQRLQGMAQWQTQRDEYMKQVQGMPQIPGYGGPPQYSNPGYGGQIRPAVGYWNQPTSNYGGNPYASMYQQFNQRGYPTPSRANLMPQQMPGSWAQRMYGGMRGAPGGYQAPTQYGSAYGTSGYRTSMGY